MGKHHKMSTVLEDCTNPLLCRYPVSVGVGNRLLPHMSNLPIRKLSCKPSTWTRSAVTAMLRTDVFDWLRVKNHAYSTDSDLAFVSPIIDYLFSGQCPLAGDREAGFFQLSQEMVVRFMGKRCATELAVKVRKMRQSAGRMCSLNGPTFVKHAILFLVQNNKESRQVYKKRKGAHRIESTFVDCSLFGSVDSARMMNQYWS